VIPQACLLGLLESIFLPIRGSVSFQHNFDSALPDTLDMTLYFTAEQMIPVVDKRITIVSGDR